MTVREQMDLDYAKAKIVIGSLELTSDKYGIQSIEIRTGAYDGNAVGIGCAYTPTCTITMQNIEEIKRGVKFEIYFLLKGYWKYFGRFWINKSPSRNKKTMTIEAHGALGQIGNRPLYAPGMFCEENQNTIRRLVAFAETTGISKVNFYPKKNIDAFLDRKITVPVKGDKATFIDVELGVLPNYPTKENGFFVFPGEKEYAEKNGISVKDFLAGIAILYGGNVTEKNGEIWIYPIVRQGTHIFDTSVCSSDFSETNETYELDCAKLKYIYTKSFDFFARTKNEFFHFPLYSGTDGQEIVWFGWEGSENGNIAYQQNVECDWVGYSAAEMYDSENYAYIDGDLSYKTGSFTFAGYNKELYAGNVILLEDEAKNLNQFYIGEVSLKWDGGFITEISCNCNAAESGSFDSSTQSGISSSANMTSAVQTQNITSFATISFSNIKDSTISGSKFIDGTITGSKIEESTITGSLIADNTLTGNLIKDGTITNNLIQDSTLTGAKIVDATIGFEKVDTSFITDLTADSAYIVILTATVANINTLKADDAIIKNIKTVGINADYIKSLKADIGYLTASEADLKYADITFGNIDTANIDTANIALLFNQVGLIDRATIVDGHITGYLDAVQINASSITAGTLDAGNIEVTNLKASSITVGQINGYQIAPGTIDMGNLSNAVTGKISEANTNANNALATADRKNTIFYQTTAPTGTHKVNDVWFDTDDANKMYGWDGSSWSDKQFGTNAISDAAITNAKISNLDAGKITTGLLDAGRIGANTITADKISAGAITSAKIAAGAITSGTIASGAINTDKLAANAVTATKIASRTITADRIVSGAITANELNVTNIFSNEAVITKIFAQDITATGKITGAKLYGAYAEINSGKIGDLSISSEEGLTFAIGNKRLRIGEHTRGDGILIFTPGDFKEAQYTDDGIHLRGEGAGWDVKITPSLTYIGTLEVTKDKVSAKQFCSENEYGHISVASDTEGGRIQLKGSGNWYEIDAAGGALRFIDGSQGKEIALMNSSAFYSKGEIVVSNNKSIRFGTPTSDYMIKGTETTITIGDKDTGGNSGYVYLQGDTKVLTGSLEAPKIKEGGILLSDKYCYYQEGFGQVAGGAGWATITVTFPKAYEKTPFFIAAQDAATATENIWTKSVSKTGATFAVYAPVSSWTFAYRWMAIGIKA